MPRLHTLRVNGNGFGGDGCAYLVSALRATKSVTRLEMCRNRLCLDGAEALASLIKFSAHLEELFVDDNLLGDDGVVHLAGAVVHCRTLRLLSLSHNAIGPRGADALCHGLYHNMAVKVRWPAWKCALSPCRHSHPGTPTPSSWR